MAQLLSKIAAQEAAKEFARIENVFVKDSLMFSNISADTDLVSAGYVWVSIYLYDTTKGVKENIDTLSCIKLDSGDTIHSLVKVAKDEGFSASTEKPLNIICYKSRIPLRYRKHSQSNESNVDELL